MLCSFCPWGVLGKICSQGFENDHRYIRQYQTYKMFIPMDFQFLVRGQSPGKWVGVSCHDVFI